MGEDEAKTPIEINPEYEVFNPLDKPIGELPVIYGFNNGGAPGWFSGALIAEDGTGLGSHLCSQEGFMYGDLGILKGWRSDRHKGFQAHYPNGYRMDFVSYGDVLNHAGLKLAFDRNTALREKSQ